MCDYSTHGAFSTHAATAHALSGKMHSEQKVFSFASLHSNMSSKLVQGSISAMLLLFSCPFGRLTSPVHGECSV